MLASSVSPTAARPFALWLSAVRAISLTATLTPAIATILLGLLRGLQPSWVIALASIAGALSLQVAVNVLNDLEDDARQIDVIGSLGGSGVLQKGWLSRAQLQRVAGATLVAGLLLGIPAFTRSPLELTVIGAIAVLGTLGYSNKPLGFKYRALGDPLVFVMCGPALTVGMSLATFHSWDRSVLLLGAAFGFAATAILHTNNAQDVDVDRRAGARTVALLLGRRVSGAYLVTLYALAFGCWFGAAQLVMPGSRLPWIVLAALPLAAGVMRHVLFERELAVPALAGLRVRAAQVHLAFGILVVSSLGVSLATR